MKKPYTVILMYINSDASLCETFLGWADVDPALDQRRARMEAVRQVMQQCAKKNKWTLEKAEEEMFEVAVFQGHLTHE